MGCDCNEGHDACECGHNGRDGGCGCDCGGQSGFIRRFATKEEQVCELEGYLEALKKEVQAVEEHIADLKK